MNLFDVVFGTTAKQPRKQPRIRLCRDDGFQYWECVGERGLNGIGGTPERAYREYEAMRDFFERKPSATTL